MRRPDGAVPFAEFDLLYQSAVQEVLGFWKPEMQEGIARHCVAWGPQEFDFGSYLRQSSRRYYYAYRCCWGAASVCDVGGFWGVFPITLARLGFAISMTEALQYYGAAFDRLFEHIRDQGVAIHDCDPFDADMRKPGRFSRLTVMAVLEHYPHSPRTFMMNMREMLESGGSLYVEVPNIAYWPKRMGMLRGANPQVPLEQVYASAVPFIGHHYEYTLADLRKLADLAGLDVVGEQAYNYSQPGRSLRWKLRHPIEALAYRFFPDAREALAVEYRLADAAPG